MWPFPWVLYFLDDWSWEVNVSYLTIVLAVEVGPFLVDIGVSYCARARRSLTVTDEQGHTERFLVKKSHVQQAANECLNRKVQEGYECLGNPEDLTIQIFFSE
jgi:hypothetical protein